MTGLDVDRLRSHFDFPGTGRVVTNNAASTQPPRELVELYRELTPWYENVHRGQSTAARWTTEMFEDAYDTIAAWINAPSRRCLLIGRNTTEAHNAVMYSLLTEFRHGDNVVTTMLEHNSNYVPWYALTHEILPRLGRTVECRLARFDADGNVDLEHLASLVDRRTKLICCTGASNFTGSRPDLGVLRRIATGSGYLQPTGERRSRLLIDGAQLVPGRAVDVQHEDLDYLSFSFHKMLAPFGVGVLYAKEHLLRHSLPFLYGGDMIAEGRVFPGHVDYNDLPWKFSAGTPNILGVIVSAQALRWLADRTASSERPLFGGTGSFPYAVSKRTMDRLAGHTARLTDRAYRALTAVDGLTVYGPRERAALISFNRAGTDPFTLVKALDQRGVEARAGCHCATLAHHALRLDPPASCRLSFAVYNNEEDVDRAVAAVGCAP